MRRAEIGIFDRVIYRGMKCIVTNPYLKNGTKAQISPVGNGNNPAIYYTVYKDELTIIR